ncbi:protein-disulfide reductase DsbD domain-containing protein, partial [Candidatus Paracaedibacter symbiosus]|uniref:protein-disulfide reductase DsbD domain-containing protein n=1 Tax=Candidatus Paracaedibacter symbiosus TaxID=244582 RepID=UPI0018DC5A1A
MVDVLSMTYFLSKILVLFALLLGVGAANPVKLDNTTVELMSDVKRIQPGKPFWIALKLTMKPGWHTYWTNPGDSGFATSLEWRLPTGFTTSPIHWIPPQRLTFGNHINFGYNNESFHLVEITPNKEISTQLQTFTAEVNWLVCEEICIPESTEISFTLLVGSEEGQPDYSEHHPLIHQLKDELPTKLSTLGEFQVKDKSVHFKISLADQGLKEIESVLLFPVKNGLINNAETQNFSFDKGILTIIVAKGKAVQTTNYEALVQLNDKASHKIHNYQVVFAPKLTLGHQPSTTEFTLLTILGLAFLGGLILNAMPCVFPILSIKALTIAKKNKSEFRHVRLQGAMYSIGVIGSFLSLAFLLIALKQGGHSIGWGFQMQSPYFITFMIYLTFLIGLSLSGLFYLPIFFGNTAAGIAEK